MFFLELIFFILAIVATVIGYSAFEKAKNLAYKLDDLQQQINNLRSSVSSKRASDIPLVSSTASVQTNSSVNVTPQNEFVEYNASKSVSFPTQSVTDSSTDYASSSDSQIADSSFDWLTKNWLLKIGAGMLILACIWFLSITYTIIPPQLQILLALLGGLLFFSVGSLCMSRALPFTQNLRESTLLTIGQVLVLLGTLIIAITMSFSERFFGFTPSVVTLMGCVVTLGLQMLLAIRFRLKGLGFVAVLGAYLVPFLSSSILTGLEAFFSLMNYILIINLLVLVTSFFTRWRFLQTLTVLSCIPFLIFIAYFNFSQNSLTLVFNSSTIGVVYTLSIVLTFFILSLFNTARQKSLLIIDTINGILSTLCLVVFVPILFVDSYRSLALAGISLLLYIIGFVAYQLKWNRNYLYLQLASSFATILVATSLQLLNSSLLPLVLGIEILIATVVAIEVFKLRTQALLISALHFVPLTFLLPTIFTFPMVYIDSLSGNLDNVSMAQLLGVFMVLILQTAYFYLKSPSQIEESNLQSVANIFETVLIFFGLRVVWIMLEQIFMALSSRATVSQNIQVANLITIVIYTLIGLGFVFWLAKAFNLARYKVFGYIILIFVLTRLFIFDIWNMDTFLRVIIFAIVGILLIASSFFNLKQKN